MPPSKVCPQCNAVVPIRLKVCRNRLKFALYNVDRVNFKSRNYHVVAYNISILAEGLHFSALVGSVCVSVKSHLTSGASVRPENAVTYSAGNEGQNICGVFSETAPLQRSSTPSVDGHTYSRPFFLRKARMRMGLAPPSVFPSGLAYIFISLPPLASLPLPLAADVPVRFTC